MAEKNTFRITWEDGNTTITEMNADLPTTKAYYLTRPFQFGDTEEQPQDLMLRSMSVEQIPAKLTSPMTPDLPAYEDEDALGEEYCGKVRCHECEGTLPESSEPNGYGCPGQDAWIEEHAHLINGPAAGHIE